MFHLTREHKIAMISSEQYGEFKGSTSAKLEIMYVEIKQLRNDVDRLLSWRSWVLGVGSAAGFVAGLASNLFRLK